MNYYTVKVNSLHGGYEFTSVNAVMAKDEQEAIDKALLSNCFDEGLTVEDNYVVDSDGEIIHRAYTVTLITEDTYKILKENGI